MLKLLSLTALMVSTSVLATATVDKTEELAGVHLVSSKENDVRTYAGSIEKLLPYPLELVKSGVTNFSERCNNNFKDDRRYTPRTVDCKYHNDHLIETVVMRDIRNRETFTGFTDVYLLGRRVYNRGHIGYYELVTVKEGVNEKNQRLVSFALRMLGDEEVGQFTAPKFKRETAFDRAESTFTLTQVSPNETKVRYDYEAKTDHWLLNKEVSVPQVFATISKSINDLLTSVEAESSLQTRNLASKE